MAGLQFQTRALVTLITAVAAINSKASASKTSGSGLTTITSLVGPSGAHEAAGLSAAAGIRQLQSIAGFWRRRTEAAVRGEGHAGVRPANTAARAAMVTAMQPVTWPSRPSMTLVKSLWGFPLVVRRNALRSEP